MGPGKAALLEAIAGSGSIAGAARAIGMSYRRAWLLVETMNRCYREPLLEMTPGGGGRAGTRLTANGRAVLTSFRRMEENARRGADVGLDDLARLLSD